MNTTEIIARLPKEVQDGLKLMKTDYKRYEANGQWREATELRAVLSGYCKAIRDCGLITEVERQRIRSYMTV